MTTAVDISIFKEVISSLLHPLLSIIVTCIEDTQSASDDRRIPIDRVGIKSVRFPLQVKDRDHVLQSTVATITLTVDLPHQFKGTHMSRFIEVLNSHGRVLHVNALKDLCREIRRRLDSEKAHLDVEFPYFIEKRAPATGAPGLMDYTARFEACDSQEGFDLVTTVVVPVSTLCPCSKAISERGAHNQRGFVTFSARCVKYLWIEEMIFMVEKCASSELFSLLKRPDEKAVTERAYDNPVFVEDLVRGVAELATADSRISWYRVEVENFESIHNHNAYALIESDKANAKTTIRP